MKIENIEYQIIFCPTFLDINKPFKEEYTREGINYAIDENSLQIKDISIFECIRKFK